MSEHESSSDIFDQPREACGVVGLMVTDPNRPVAALTTAALAELQHRGQDGAGVSVGNLHSDAYPFLGRKGLGLIGRALQERDIAGLDASTPAARVALGHARYGTSHRAARDPFDTLQPFHFDDFALGHNGEIPNIDEVAARYGLARRYDSDSHALGEALQESARRTGSLESALAEVLPQLKGAYSLVIAQKDRLFGARDPYGFRPLSIGTFPGDSGVVIASEEPAFTAVGATRLRDVQPGEVVCYDANKITSFEPGPQTPRGLCSLEYAYFSRPDGRIEGVSVSAARFCIGRELAREQPVDADIVLGVPDSGVIAAAGYAKQASLPHEQHGLTRSPYEIRGFIKPTQAERRKAARQKLRPDSAVLDSRRLIVIDDSLLRGTTMGETTDMLRDAGAKEVHVLISFPLVRHGCNYGIDIGDTDQLLANGRNLEQMRAEIRADSLEFISTAGLRRAIMAASRQGDVPAPPLCMGCATGEYPVSMDLQR